MLYILLGPPASGKGTQAGLLSQALSIPHISTGALLRELKERKPEIGEQIDNGKVVTDDYIRQIYTAVAKRFPENLILDGAIRSVNQVDIILELWNTDDLRIIWLEIPDETIRSRSLHRDTTTRDKRPDDRLPIVEERIEYYRHTKQAILNHLKRHGIELILIDGNQPIEIIHKAILKKLT